MRLQNNIVEYVHSKNLEDIKDGIKELGDNEKIQKSICIGHFIMWSFSQIEKEAIIVIQLIISLKNLNFISSNDIEEGYSNI
jgi:hypothetical protein